jgi:hypothetical protein
MNAQLVTITKAARELTTAGRKHVKTRGPGMGKDSAAYKLGRRLIKNAGPLDTVMSAAKAHPELAGGALGAGAGGLVGMLTGPDKGRLLHMLKYILGGAAAGGLGGAAYRHGKKQWFRDAGPSYPRPPGFEGLMEDRQSANIVGDAERRARLGLPNLVYSGVKERAKARGELTGEGRAPGYVAQ